MHNATFFENFSLNGLPGIGHEGGPVGAIVLATGDLGITAEAMVEKTNGEGDSLLGGGAGWPGGPEPRHWSCQRCTSDNGAC